MKKASIKRVDAHNRTAEDLLNDGWVFLGERHELIAKALLNSVRSELDRLYWNENQKEMVSPFDNTGADDFKTEYLTIRSYNWSGNDLPNFDTDQIKMFWYKHSNRGVEIMVKDAEKADSILVDVLNKSIESINLAFEKKGK